jgi:signal transduction histidine kinase/ActR/RegA family two-component response regulator
MKLLDFFIPDSKTTESPDHLRRARILAGTSLALVSVGIVFGINRFVSDSGPGTIFWAFCAITLAIAANLIILKYFNALALASALTGIELISFAVAMAYVNGGPLSPSYIWFVLFPVLLAFVLGSRVALQSAFFLVVVTIGFHWMRVNGHEFHIKFEPDVYELTRTITTVLALIFSAALGLLYEKSRKSAQKTLKRTLFDLTQANEGLKRAKEAAETANQSKNVFLANMSHEIRSPLHSVIGLSRLLLEQELPDKQLNYAKSIQSCSYGLLNILNDVLDFSKLDIGKLRLEKIDFSAKQLFGELVQFYRFACLQKDLEFSYVEEEPIPVWLKGDPTRIRQILMNLLSNAVKFSKVGKVTLKVSVHTDNPDSKCLLMKVIDTGVGIRQDHHERIFESFEQADDSIVRTHGGTGLGLSISRQLAELMKGDIALESDEGQGSCFTLRIPLEESDSQTAPEFEEESGQFKLRLERLIQHTGVSLDQHLRPKILLAEDNPIHQAVSQTMLKQLGYDVTVVSNGRELVDRFEPGKYVAVITDGRMPSMDGYEACKEIRKREQGLSRTPVIALTASALDTENDLAFQAGMDDHLCKPVVPEMLERVLARWVQSTSELQEAQS